MGLEADAAVRIGAGRAVFQVALDGAADMGELATDLVMPAGQEPDGEQVVTFRASEIAVFETCELCFSGRLPHDVGFVLRLVAGHPVLEEGLRFLRLPAAEGKVGLVDRARTEEFRQALERLACLCKEADAADGTVQAVGDAHEDFSGFPVALRDKSFQRLRQAFIPGLVSLHDFSRPFVQCQDVVVLIEDPFRQILILLFR